MPFLLLLWLPPGHLCLSDRGLSKLRSSRTIPLLCNRIAGRVSPRIWPVLVRMGLPLRHCAGFGHMDTATRGFHQPAPLPLAKLFSTGRINNRGMARHRRPLLQDLSGGQLVRSDTAPLCLTRAFLWNVLLGPHSYSGDSTCCILPHRPVLVPLSLPTRWYTRRFQ